MRWRKDALNLVMNAQSDLPKLLREIALKIHHFQHAPRHRLKEQMVSVLNAYLQRSLMKPISAKNHAPRHRLEEQMVSVLNARLQRSLMKPISAKNHATSILLKEYAHHSKQLAASRPKVVSTADLSWPKKSTLSCSNLEMAASGSFSA